ncbi:MAG TPA: hypothetical protein DEQ02_07890 [Ruminococcaceae bacterium]|nr:hypothetical protein [Oscillospiraceae bacterium]
MLHTIFLPISVAVWVTSIVLAAYTYKSKQRKPSLGMNLFIAGTFIALSLIFIPVYNGMYSGGAAGLFKTALGAMHNALRCFVLDGEIDYVQQFTNVIESDWIGGLYSLWASILYITAPMLTFGVVMSFFGNFTARLRFRLGWFKREIYVLSELNDKSLSLAKSIKQERVNPMVVFCNCPKEGDMLDRAHKMNAVCLRAEITDIKLKFRNNAEVFLFAIGENASKNLTQSIDLVNRYLTRENLKLYVFSTRPECDLIINAAGGENAKIKVYRVNNVQSLIYSTLYEHSIFENAVHKGERKKIIAVVVGLGQYGAEMLKGLCWCGQMNGYDLEIHAFDQAPDAGSRIEAKCPDLIAHSGKGGMDEDCYSLTIHNGLDYGTVQFNQAVCALSDVTLVFAALGSDEKNLDAALDLRALLEKQGSYPDILAVVYDSGKSKLMRKNPPLNFKNQPMDITFIGDLESQYSYYAIIRSELEQKALTLHCRWGDEASFYRFDYNYRSSMALAIHAKWKTQCGIPKEAAAELEHKRWNAYMRGLGYQYGAVRNDRAKLHPDLVGYNALTQREQQKDEKIVI